MGLLWKLIYKDYQKNRIITLALSVFLILSALLMAGGLRVTGTIASSLYGLNQIAVPPEYFQMHKGSFDEEKMKQFAETHDNIEDTLIVKMLNISNADIFFKGETLEKCLMDNGLVTQSIGFDYLLNMNNEVAVVRDGEIGVPVYYAQEYGICEGDQIVLENGEYRKELTVSNIIRDSSMNSGLTYSKRFLVSEEDLEEISTNMGEWEFIFEYLLKEGVSTAQLERDYLEAGLPSNGVAITGSLLAMLNVLSYGLVAVIIIAISMLLIMVALLCLSYIIRVTMAEENRTIGEMRAIGFPGKIVKKLYQMKYVLLMAIAGVVGYIMAIPFGDLASSSVILYCGNGDSQWKKWVYPIVGVILLGLLVVYRCGRIIRKNLQNTVVGLMRGDEIVKKEGHFTLPLRGLKHRNLTIAMGELKCKWKEYLVIFFVFVVSSFLILLPMNMKNTIHNPSFISYMGVGKCDIRIHIQFCDNMLEQKDTMESYFRSDPDILKYTMSKNANILCRNAGGEWEYIRVGNGDESVFPLDYLEGNAPTDKDEIALSYMNANELGKDVGDVLTVNYQGMDIPLTVCGIYQDITYGGKTTKAMIDFRNQDVEGYIFYLQVKDGVSIQEKAEELRNILMEGKVVPVEEFVSQTLGGLTDNIRLVEWAAAAISLLLVILITAMFLQLITAREHSAIAVKKAIGLSNRDIRIQLGIRIAVIQLLGIITGTILANTLGEVIFGILLSSTGIARITLLIEPISAYFLCPLVQSLVVLVTVILGTRVIRNYHIRDQIME